MREGTWKSLWLGGRDFAVFLTYTGVALWGLSLYEPWEDEGRAWMIARSFGLGEMLFRILRYEGHPALWYLTLWAPSHLHVPYVAINGISVALGCAGAWVLLRYAPFPFWLRAVLPFGFWLAYEYSVVAREYVFLPLLGFAAAHLYRRSPARPVMMATVLGLLANASVYGALVAIGFAIAYARKQSREREGWSREMRRHAALGIGVFASSMVFLAICLRPPRDWQTPLSPNVKKVLGHVMPVNYEVVRVSTGAKSLPAPPADAESRVATRLSLIFSYPVFDLWIPSLALELLTVVFVVRRGEALLVVPLVLLCGFMATVYCKIWHAGLVWVTLILLSWAAWDETERFRVKSLQGALAMLLTAAGAVQVFWTIGAIRYERSHNTYPAEATAKYLKTLPPGTTLDGNALAFTILPYFSANPFTRYEMERYGEHGQYPADERLTRILGYAPDVVVLRGTEDGEPQDDEGIVLGGAGYRQTHTFCGGLYFPDRKPKPICLIAFERRGSR